MDLNEYFWQKEMYPRPSQWYLEIVRQADDQKCVLCGNFARTVHHILPCLVARVRKIGFKMHRTINLVTVCNYCHDNIIHAGDQGGLTYQIDCAEKGIDLRNTEYDSYMYSVASRRWPRIKRIVKETPVYDINITINPETGIFEVRDISLSMQPVIARRPNRQTAEEYALRIEKAHLYM